MQTCMYADLYVCRLAVHERQANTAQLSQYLYFCTSKQVFSYQQAITFVVVKPPATCTWLQSSCRVPDLHVTLAADLNLILAVDTCA